MKNIRVPTLLETDNLGERTKMLPSKYDNAQVPSMKN